MKQEQDVMKKYQFEISEMIKYACRKEKVNQWVQSTLDIAEEKMSVL